MQAIVPQYVQSFMVRKGMGKAEAEAVLAVVAKPKAVRFIDDSNNIVLVGRGIEVIGATDETGKFFTVKRVDFIPKA
jgi:hypothetical protein